MLARLAFLNLWRQKKRTLITAISVAFGLWIETVHIGVRHDTHTRLVASSVKMGLGHIAVAPHNFLTLPSPALRIENADELQKRVEALPEVKKTLMRVSGTAVVNSARSSTGVVFLGIDTKQDTADYNIFVASLKEGAVPEPDDELGCLVGRDLAEKLGLRLNSKLVYNTTGTNGELISELARIRGIFVTGNPELDGHAMIMHLGTIQKSLGYDAKNSSYLAVYLKDSEQLDKSFAKIAPLAPPGSDALKWYESQPDLANFFRIERVTYFIFLVLVGVIISSGIVNTMMMNVVERRRELGIMLALGCSPFQLFSVIVIEAICIGFLGVGIGFISVIPLYYYLHTYGIDLSTFLENGFQAGGVALSSVVYCTLNIPTIFLIMAGLLLLTVLSSIYPATKAALTVPIKAIRDQ
jgi:ABC-type lipoprotein release transport system permease subunit